MKKYKSVAKMNGNYDIFTTNRIGTLLKLNRDTKKFEVVRVLSKINDFERSSSGRTAGFDPVNPGSIPGLSSKLEEE